LTKILLTPVATHDGGEGAFGNSSAHCRSITSIDDLVAALDVYEVEQG
jgi:hypothetical protein